MPLNAEQKQALEDHFKRRGWAVAQHSRELANEIGQRNPSHAISRHGYQTGWESQLVRLMTGEAPDQPFAPDGVRPSHETWTRSDGDMQHYPEPTRNRNWAAADSTGAFLGPEVEQISLNIARNKVLRLHTFDEAEMRTKSGATSWQAFRYSVAIVRPPSALCGVSFVRDKSKPKVGREAFERIMAAFEARELLAAGPSSSMWDQMQLRRFYTGEIDSLPSNTRAVCVPAQFDDFLKLLHVKAEWMKHCRIVFRRYGNTWRIHTAFAVNNPTGYGPDLPGRWTGQVRMSGGVSATLPTI